MDDKRFEEIRNKVIGVERERYGIGTLKEKTLHAILKDYYAPDKQHKTMMNILSAERSSLECSQRQESEQYEREKQKKLNKLYNEIEIMKSEIDGYTEGR